METAAAVEKSENEFFHSSLQNACWRFAQFPQARRRYQTNKQQNRTFHLLQKPDIFICYRQAGMNWQG